MKLTIKTLNQKTVQVEFDEKKTVWDLKVHLCSLPEINIVADLQQIIYAGRILNNIDPLSAYSIDERKFLVVMSKKPPTGNTKQSKGKGENVETKAKANKLVVNKADLLSARPPQHSPTSATVVTGVTTTTTTANTKSAAQTTSTASSSTTPSHSIGRTHTANTGLNRTEPATQVRNLLHSIEQPPTTLVNEQMVRNIVTMGYPEADVRRALIASYNNPDRAIDYLIEGIPEFPDMSEPSDLREISNNENPLSFLRDDTRLAQMRRILQQRPELLSTVLASIGQSNPALLTLIREHQDEFLRMLNVQQDDSEQNELPQVIRLELSEADNLAIQRLVDLGFNREIVLQAYMACDKNEEQTADLLFRQMED